MTADTVGGVWTYALELADAVGGAGVETVLATMGRPLSADQWRAAEASAVTDVRESEYPLEWMDGCWEGVEAAGDWLLGLEEEVRPDVVHLNGYVHGALPWRAPAVIVGHSCVLSWWEAVKGQHAPEDWATYRDRVAAGLHAARCVIAPSAAMLAELRRHYGVADGEVIANARSERAPWPGPKEPLIVAAGRVWDEAKNVAALAIAAPALEWPVAIAGEGGGEFRLLAGRSPASFLGPLPFEELAGWLARASVFALPARYEPFGLAALEAGLAGCALVLGDIPSLREVWGDAATFVDPDDHGELTRTLQELTAQPALVTELGGRARQRACTYSPERMAAAYLDAWESA